MKNYKIYWIADCDYSTWAIGFGVRSRKGFGGTKWVTEIGLFVLCLHFEINIVKK